MLISRRRVLWYFCLISKDKEMQSERITTSVPCDLISHSKAVIPHKIANNSLNEELLLRSACLRILLSHHINIICPVSDSWKQKTPSPIWLESQQTNKVLVWSIVELLNLSDQSSFIQSQLIWWILFHLKVPSVTIFWRGCDTILRRGTYELKYKIVPKQDIASAVDWGGLSSWKADSFKSGIKVIFCNVLNWWPKNLKVTGIMSTLDFENLKPSWKFFTIESYILFSKESSQIYITIDDQSSPFAYLTRVLLSHNQPVHFVDSPIPPKIVFLSWEE